MEGTGTPGAITNAADAAAGRVTPPALVTPPMVVTPPAEPAAPTVVVVTTPAPEPTPAPVITLRHQLPLKQLLQKSNLPRLQEHLRMLFIVNMLQRVPQPLITRFIKRNRPWHQALQQLLQ
jgi:hypothetical protein